MPTRRELANAIRALSMDAVQRANSGHPGAPMGLADIAEVLWRDVLKFNPGNRPGHKIIDHHTYAFAGDGCLMEGISHEIGSFAGVQKLGKLIVVYDDNGISIDGKVQGWFADNTALRFEAYGWHVLSRVDGHDSEAIAAALAAARAVTDRPSLICAKTVIGWGAPNKQGTASMHGGSRCRAARRSSVKTTTTSKACCLRRSRAAWRSKPARANRGGTMSACKG